MAIPTTSPRLLVLLVNGVIHTMDSARPRASAVAVERASGRVVAVGDDAEIRALGGSLAETVDLRGNTVLPGFIDAHAHLLCLARARLEVDLGAARSEDAAAARVGQAASRAAPSAWIIGQHWDKNRWTPSRFPSRASIDAAAPGHPVALWSYDGHSLWVSSEALRRAGVTRETPEPVGGSIQRDADGEPTGMLFEYGATSLVESAAGPPDEATDLAGLRTVLADVRARGITGVHDIHTLEHDRSFRLMQRLRDSGELSPRILFYVRKQRLPEVVTLGLQAGFGDDSLRFGGIKVFADGALTSQTAALFDPYEGETANRGLLTTSADETEALAIAAADGDIGVAIHAIGDRAVHAALDGIEGALAARAVASARDQPGHTRHPARYRIEHVQLARPDDLARMARLGVVASVQPYHAMADRDKADRYWGQRARLAYAYRAMRDAGIHLALGSDVPVDTFDPLRILHAAVTRRDDLAPDRAAWHPEQTLTVAEAIHAYTVGAAYAGGQEAHQGSISPGKLADFVILTEDPFTIPAERLPGMEIAATIVGGAVVHGTLD
ncbi:MAG TPA: amidohydrolase [Ktedonobacterales bacterium]|jgi:hypothetical protein